MRNECDYSCCALLPIEFRVIFSNSCRPPGGPLRHGPAVAHLLPAAVLPHVLQHGRCDVYRCVALDTRVSRRVLQRGGHAARRAGREVQRDTRHAHNVHRHASPPASRAVRPLLVARWSGRRRANASRGRATGHREAPHAANSGRVNVFCL